MNNFLSKLNLYYQDYIPKIFTCFREGYSLSTLRDDLIAGFTVGIIALPLAMAFAIGSGVTPERGLFTAIIGGFLISLLGGSRVQIGGPTGTFVVIVYTIVQKFGYEGLALVTLIGGFLMILMGLTRCGLLLKFIPYPVTVGFTTGIAFNIFSSQIKDFFGLRMDHVPVEFLNKWTQYGTCAHTCNGWALLIAIGTLAFLFISRRLYPRLPGTMLAIILATLITQFFHLPIETLTTKFGELPHTIPWPSFPSFSLDSIRQVFPDAITLALLGGIESLLSAMVADGMIGHRHRSNGELVAQGLANMGSVMFGGIPATGAIARTTTNIKMGAKTPVAGMFHALTLLLIMLFFAPLVSQVPLASLAAILIFVAWNMSEFALIADILRSQFADALVLVITFSLTVLVNLSVAVQVGVILSAILFLKRMTDSTTIDACRILIQEEANYTDEARDTNILLRDDVPSDVTIFEIKGPFFFGVSDLLNEALRRLTEKPRVFVLRMRQVPMVDTTGLQALKKFAIKCQTQGIIFMISGAREELRILFRKTKLEDLVGRHHIFPHIDAALTSIKRDYNKELDISSQNRLETG